MDSHQHNVLQLLKDSLSEVQTSVRSYDTKAQIVGVGYIFALNVIGQISAQIPTHAAADIFTIIVAWSIVIMPIILFGYVLYPVRKSVLRSDGQQIWNTCYSSIRNAIKVRKHLSMLRPLVIPNRKLLMSF